MKCIRIIKKWKSFKLGLKSILFEKLVKLDAILNYIGLDHFQNFSVILSTECLSGRCFGMWLSFPNMNWEFFFCSVKNSALPNDNKYNFT